MDERPLRQAMLAYGRSILFLSAIISISTAAMLFLAARFLIVRPITRLTRHIQKYQAAPEDARRIIQPHKGMNEMYNAEVALESMQTELSQSLRQKDRLATLGTAVSKISHDLRNILTTTTLLTDRLEMSDDPSVQRIAPKLVKSLSRAVNLCETTLAFGKVEETAPNLLEFPVNPMLQDVVESELLARKSDDIHIILQADDDMMVSADEEQIHRVVSNLVRNSRQVLEARRQPGTITIRTGECENNWRISVTDSGPGLPEKARENLFTAFQGGASGTGLGLAISAELVKGHGGRLELQDSTAEGTTFQITLPKEIAS